MNYKEKMKTVAKRLIREMKRKGIELDFVHESLCKSFFVKFKDGTKFDIMPDGDILDGGFSSELSRSNPWFNEVNLEA